MSESKIAGNLGFEQFTGDPQELWRVTAFRSYRKHGCRTSNWFASEDKALAYAKWLESEDAEDIRVSHYMEDAQQAAHRDEVGPSEN